METVHSEVSGFDVSERAELVAPQSEESKETTITFSLDDQLKIDAQVKAIRSKMNLSQVLRDFLKAWANDNSDDCPCRG